MQPTAVDMIHMRYYYRGEGIACNAV